MTPEDKENSKITPEESEDPSILNETPIVAEEAESKVKPEGLEPDSDAELQKEGEKEEEKPPEEKEEGPPKKRIVVIDSKEKTLDATISTLRKGDYSVIGVESSKEFFEVTTGDTQREGSSFKGIEGPTEYFSIIVSKLPDLIITDLDLKDLDGWELIYRLKFEGDNYEYKEIPIIVLTDEPITSQTPRRLVAESIHDYIIKEKVKGKELLEKIDKYFETREKLSVSKQEIWDSVAHRVAAEYERISLAIRIRLKYLHALTKELEAFKEKGAPTQDIKNLEEIIYLEKRNLIKYERRKREIKRMVKKRKVKKDDGGAGDSATETEPDGNTKSNEE